MCETRLGWLPGDNVFTDAFRVWAWCLIMCPRLTLLDAGTVNGPDRCCGLRDALWPRAFAEARRRSDANLGLEWAPDAQRMQIADT